MPRADIRSCQMITLAYVLVGLGVAVFIWYFADALLSAPAYYPAIDQRHNLELGRIAAAFLTGQPHSWLPFRATLPSQYNALFAVPLVPALVTYGSSFYVFGMSIAVVYATTAAIATGALAAFVLSGESRGVAFVSFTATTLWAITRSAAWFTTRHYYPDIGNALVLALWFIGALALLDRPDWRRTLVLTLLTVGVILFRRHLLFAWGASGIGLAASVVAAYVTGAWDSDLPQVNRRCRACVVRLGLLAVSAITALALLALVIPSFVREMVLIGSTDAYRDYERAPHDVLMALVGVIGIFPLLASAGGYALAALMFRRRRFAIIGIGLAGALHVFFWIISLRQIGPQYYVVPGAFFVPVGIGLGTAGLAALARTWQRTTALAVTMVLLFLSADRLVYGAMRRIDDPLVPHLWQARLAPLDWHAGMKRPFLQVFSRIRGPAEPIRVFVVASNHFINEGITQSAAEALLGPKAARFSFFWVPAVDARDRLPLTELLQADYVLVVDPPLSDLPTGNDGLHAVVDMFTHHEPASLDFRAVGDSVAFPTFSIRVYQRIQPSDDATDIAALDQLEAAVPLRGFHQPAWVEVGAPDLTGTVQVWTNDVVVAHDRGKPSGWPARFLSYDRVGAAVALHGDAETSCPKGAVLILHAALPQNIPETAPLPLATDKLTGVSSRQNVTLALRGIPAATHLELEIYALGSDKPCDVTLRHLKMAHRP